MILYHGSNVIIKESKSIRTEQGRDFGFGFYTTDIHDQAVRWAIRKAKIAARRGMDYSPYVSVFEFDETALEKLKYKGFDLPSLD